MGISLLSLWLTLLWYPWPCSLKTKMFKSKSNLKHFINLLNFFLKNYFFCRKSISEPADGPWLKSIFFYSNGFLFWLRKKIMEHLSVLADIYSTIRKPRDAIRILILSLMPPHRRKNWSSSVLPGLTEKNLKI